MSIRAWLRKNLGFALGSRQLGDELTDIIDNKADTNSDAKFNSVEVTTSVEADSMESVNLKAADGEITLLESVNFESVNVDTTNLSAKYIKIKDLDDSNLLTVLWDEDDLADRKLKLKVDSGDRTLEITGDSKINQDVTVESTPTFDSANLNGVTPTIDTDPTGLDPKDLVLKCGTEKTLEFETTVWDDLRVPAQSTRINPATSKPDFEIFLGGTRTFYFDPSTAETVHFAVQLPHAYKLGTDLHPHLHWAPLNTNTGNVLWRLEYTIAMFDEVFIPTQTLDVLAAASGVAYAHQKSSFAPISGSAITKVSTMLICSLSRIGGDSSDTYASDAALLEIDFHYQIDTLGSRRPTEK
jgi:hypothetical protein